MTKKKKEHYQRDVKRGEGISRDPVEFQKVHGFWPDWGMEALEKSGKLQESVQRTITNHTAQIEAGEVTVPEITKLALDEINSRYIQPAEVELAETEGQVSEIDKELDALSYQFKRAYTSKDRSRIMGEKKQLLELRSSIVTPLVRAGLIDAEVESATMHVTISEDKAAQYMNAKPKEAKYQSEGVEPTSERPAPLPGSPPRMHPKSGD